MGTVVHSKSDAVELYEVPVFQPAAHDGWGRVQIRGALRWYSTRRRTSMGNTTTLCGNLTADPEIRYTRDGAAQTTFGIAVNERRKVRGSEDEFEEETSFFDVVCWRDMAENVALSLVKGSRVVVTGNLQQRCWETEAGERKKRVEVVAEDIGASLRFATAEVSSAYRPAEVSS
jgi:single-strand DNA-binding protein